MGKIRRWFQGKPRAVEIRPAPWKPKDNTVFFNKINNIQHIVAVIGAKGGCGKTTIACAVARGLRDAGFSVGVLDADVTTPDLPQRLGITQLEPTMEQVETDWIGTKTYPMWIPLMVEGMKVFSIGNLVKDEPILWRGRMKERFLLDCFLGVKWGDLDYLVMDYPPTTSTEQLEFEGLLQEKGVAVLVTNGSPLSMIDTQRCFGALRLAEIPVVGVIENMNSLVCPHCNQVVPLHPEGTVEEYARRMKIRYLGSLPLILGLEKMEYHKKPPFDTVMQSILHDTGGK